MKAPYRDTQPRPTAAANPLDVDKILGPLLAVEKVLGPRDVAMWLFIGGLLGPALAVLTYLMLRGGSFTFMVIVELIPSFVIVGPFWMLTRPLRRIEAREKGLVYVWSRPQAHGSHVRFIAWDEITRVIRIIVRHGALFRIHLSSGETLFLGYSRDEVVKIALERVRPPENSQS